LLSSIRACLKRGAPARLSHYLNKRLLPLHHPLDVDANLAQMISIQPLGGAKPGVRGCVLEVLDVTIEADREMKLRKKIRELARANANLEVFTAAASHDLKAPLRAMQMMASNVEQELRASNTDLPEGVLDKLERIGLRSKQMNALLDDLLTYCRLDSEQASPQKLDPVLVIKETVELLSPPPGFMIEVAEELPIIWGGKTELALIVRNLISNAIRHHDQATGRISITGGQNETQSWLHVADDGVGIDPDDFSEIFAPFVSKSHAGGSGLGLAMVDRLAQNRNGAVSVRSPLYDGRGAMFTITLPKPKNDGHR
jgi:signal transduction histidine kinase